MGVRLYNPVTGRFLSTDPVYSGGANAYAYPADPINNFDLDGRKVQAKYNKNSRSCSFWQGTCVIKLSRARAWKASWDIIGGATAWGVSAALFGVASAGILSAAMAILAGVVTWVAVNIQRVHSSFPNRGVQITIYLYGRISMSHQQLGVTHAVPGRGTYAPPAGNSCMRNRTIRESSQAMQVKRPKD
ncbi:hypothetical protein GCM10018966_103460 [Streptomyces yanii]